MEEGGSNVLASSNGRVRVLAGLGDRLTRTAVQDTVREMVAIGREELQAKTGAPLTFAPDCEPLTAPPIEVTD